MHALARTHVHRMHGSPRSSKGKKDLKKKKKKKQEQNNQACLGHHAFIKANRASAHNPRFSYRYPGSSPLATFPWTQSGDLSS